MGLQREVVVLIAVERWSDNATMQAMAQDRLVDQRCNGVTKEKNHQKFSHNVLSKFRIFVLSLIHRSP